VNQAAGGTVNPSGTNWYNSGDNVPISAAANPGYTFSEWSGDLSGATNPTSIAMVNGPKSVTANFTAAPNSTVTVLSPNGGEIIPSGSSFSIQWAAPPQAVRFKLSYSVDNGLSWKQIESAATGNLYPWQVPTTKRNRKTCLIRVIGYDASNRVVGQDTSDKPFTIEVVKLTVPNDGRMLASGESLPVTWITNETRDPVTQVKLFFTKDGGATWDLIERIEGNPLSYNWSVPDIPSKKCKLRIVLKDAKGNTLGSDANDDYFPIYSSTP